VYICGYASDVIEGIYQKGYSFTAKYESGVATGKLFTPTETRGLTWKFDFNLGTIAASYYSDKSSYSTLATLTYKSGSVTLSQCKGKVLIGAYTGIWYSSPNNATINLCTREDDLSITGILTGPTTLRIKAKYENNGTISGTYTTTDTGTSGFLQATASLDQNKLSLFTNYFLPNITLIRISQTVSTLSCGSWPLFWTKKYGRDISGNVPLKTDNLFAGCFSVCIAEEKSNTFSALFHLNDINVTGTIDSITGTLSGTTVNKANKDYSYLVVIEIIDIDSVQITFTDLLTEVNDTYTSTLYQY